MNDYDAVKSDISEIKTTVKDIFKILNGNGANGLVTRVALNKQSISRVWWWVGILSATFVSGSVYFLFRSAA